MAVFIFGCLRVCVMSASTLHGLLTALQVKMCLVINKIDRLVLETRLTPAEAYERLKVRLLLPNLMSGPNPALWRGDL